MQVDIAARSQCALQLRSKQKEGKEQKEQYLRRATQLDGQTSAHDRGPREKSALAVVAAGQEPICRILPESILDDPARTDLDAVTSVTTSRALQIRKLAARIE